MTFILTLKGVRKLHNLKKMTNNVFKIQIKGASNERVREPLGPNISDGPRGATTTGLKALASVDNISVSPGGGSGQSVEPRRLLGKVGRILGV